MTTGLVFSFIVAAASVAGTAAADETSPTGPPQILGIKGTCSLFRLDRQADTKGCKGLAINSVVNGYVDFIFFDSSDGKETMITFSGRGKQIRPDDNTALQPVDRVILAHEGKSDEPVTAVGTCRYTNPYLGKPAIIDCQAQADGGHEFETKFTSDGSEPSSTPAPP